MHHTHPTATPSLLTAAALALLCLGGTAQAQSAPPAVLPTPSVGATWDISAIPHPVLELNPGLLAAYNTSVTGMDGRCAPLRSGPTFAGSAAPGAATVVDIAPLPQGQPYVCDATVHWASGAQSRAQVVPPVLIAPDPAVAPPAGVIAPPPTITADLPQSLTLHFTPLADPGIDGYIAMCIDGLSPGASTLYRLGIATGSPVTVSGLQAGVAHVCAVQPYNAGGVGPGILAADPATPLPAPGGALPVPTLGEWALALLTLAAAALGARALRGRQNI